MRRFTFTRERGKCTVPRLKLLFNLPDNDVDRLFLDFAAGLQHDIVPVSLAEDAGDFGFDTGGTAFTIDHVVIR